jgi:hypothetical protein
MTIIYTLAILARVVNPARINNFLAEISCKSFHTLTLKTIHLIYACATISARVRFAFININFTLLSNVTGKTLTLKSIHLI